MKDYVARVEAYGVHRRFNLQIDFDRDINVLFGKNGTGKTTLLHIIANMLNGTIERFVYLDFSRILLITRSDQHIELLRTTSDTGSSIALMLNGQEIKTFDVVETRKGLQVDRPELVRRERDELERSKLIREQLGVNPPAYFPAFRTMIEAWRSIDLDDHAYRVGDPYMYSRVRPFVGVTSFARRLFGDFVPPLNYPSPLEIETELSREVEYATYSVARESQKILTNAFMEVFRTVLSQGSLESSESTNMLLEEIRGLLQGEDTVIAEEGSVDTDDIYVQLRNIIASKTLSPVSAANAAASVLSVYRNALERQNTVRQFTYAAIDRYVASVNVFLEQKRLEVSRYQQQNRRRRVSVLLADGTRTSLRTLSSGERQIVSMLYAASPALAGPASIVGSSDVLLIDEPEISLHVDWQRALLSKMVEQVGDRQIIVCTHSPEIGAEYEDKYREVVYEPIRSTTNATAEIGDGSVEPDEDAL